MDINDSDCDDDITKLRDEENVKPPAPESVDYVPDQGILLSFYHLSICLIWFTQNTQLNLNSLECDSLAVSRLLTVYLTGLNGS